MAHQVIELVLSGSPNATVVLAPDVGPSATEAAHDMVRVIEKMSGAKLPVVADGQALPSGPQVHIGRTTFVREEGLLPDDLPVNGYRIAAVQAASASRLIIAANSSLDISHGIYDLLTSELGVLWGMADPLFEDIPVRRTVSVKPLDRIERPAFGFRVFSGVDPAWLRRNRMDDGSRMPPFYHNLYNIFPPSRYADHPEYYAMIDGQRKVPEKDGHTRIQPCLSNPDVIRITVETVRRFFDENPGVSAYSLSPNDSAGFCECPSCRVLDDGMEAYRGRRMNSDSYFYYIDGVARELLKSHPNRYVSVLAYWTTELPPRRIDRLPPNVLIALTQDSSQYYDPAYERRDRDILEKWSKAAHYLAMYDYYGLGWFTPRLFTQIVARTLPFLRRAGVKGFFCEAYPYWAHTAPQLYLATRLLWDTSLDADAVLDEWYARMFQEAAPDVRRYFEVLERGWTDRGREGKWFLGLGRLHVQLMEWPKETRDEAWGHIQAAHNAAKSEIARRRVEYVRQGNRLAYLLSKTIEEVHALSSDQSDLERTLEGIFARVKETTALFRSAVESDLTYGSAYYRGERAARQLSWWMGYTASIINEVLADRADLQKRLAAEDSTYREMMEAMAHPAVSQRIQEARETWLSQVKR